MTNNCILKRALGWNAANIQRIFCFVQGLWHFYLFYFALCGKVGSLKKIARQLLALLRNQLLTFRRTVCAINFVSLLRAVRCAFRPLNSYFVGAF